MKNVQKFLKGIVVLTLITNLVSLGFAQLKVEVSKAASNAIPIAIIGENAQENFLKQIVQADLKRSGRFLPATNVPQVIKNISEIDQNAWTGSGTQYAVLITVSGSQVQADLMNTFSKESLIKRTYSVNSNERNTRKVAHQIADMIYEKILNVKGSFDTKLAYVTKSGRNYQLVVSDADGAFPSVIFNSVEPILSPRWSPNGREIAYASLEGKYYQIIVQDVYSGKRRVIVKQPGINSAPTWSPDGNQLAFTLSKDGNPEIYTASSSGGNLRRLTSQPAIDTEPFWAANGMIYFTSDAGGNPQIYRVSSQGGVPQRVTNTGNYNASPSVSRDGRYLAVMHRNSSTGNGFGIAVFDLQTGQVKRLTSGGKDESPSFSANGHMIIYSNGYGQLKAVSNDWRISQNFSGLGQDVREPTWSYQ